MLTGTRLIDIAHAAGADSVKFQILFADGLYLPISWESGVQKPSDVVAKRKATELDDHQWWQLALHARGVGIPFSASVFDERSLDLLTAFDPPYIKLASTDLTNYPLIQAAAERGLPLILSTGMATLSDIEKAMAYALRESRASVILLHCVSRYPTPVAAAGLGFITTLRQEFDSEIGYSDHTESSAAACAAVALGATWFEKHFTHDRSADGFDHGYAMEPAGLTSYITDLRAVEEALSATDRTLSAEELSVRQRARRALYAARDVQAGEVLQRSDLLIVRPEGPVDPTRLHEVLGKRARRSIVQYEPISVENLA